MSIYPYSERPGETPLDRALRFVAEAPLDLTCLSRSDVLFLECMASKVIYERRDHDGSAADLQEVACDRLAVLDGESRHRVDLVEAAQARRGRAAATAERRAA